MKKLALFLALLAAALMAVPGFADDFNVSDDVNGEISISLPVKQTADGDVLITLINQSGQEINGDTFADDPENPEINAFAEALNVTIKDTYPALSEAADEYFLLIHSDTLSETELLEQVRQRPEVTGASLNYVIHTFDTVPNDPSYSNEGLWGLRAINAPKAWDTSTGSDNIYSAVIDTGVEYTHSDLSANFETNGYSRNFVSSISDPNAYYDEHSHGTHVAGTIGAVGNNNNGIVGVNWKTKIIALRVLNARGSGYTSDIIKAINYVTDILKKNPSLKIASVNLSLGGYQYTTPQEMISNNNVDYKAYSLLSQTNRTVICVAAGNESIEVGEPAPYDDPYGDFKKGQYCYPASFRGIDNMVVVASATSSKTRSYFSNYSAKYVDITAPGSSIYSTVLNNSYGTKSGTSMATPHVAGAAALLMSVNPSATAKQLKEALIAGANRNFCVTDGTSVNGFLDLAKSIEYLNTGGAPKITTEKLPATTTSGYYSYELKASGNTPLTWSLIAGKLPENLTLDSSGKIYGYVSPADEGTHEFTVKVTNYEGSDTKELSLFIGVKPSIMDFRLPGAVVGEEYQATLEAIGTEPLTWSLYSGSLPTGLSLDIDGIISGVPSYSGTSSFYVKVENELGSTSEIIYLNVQSSNISDITITSEKLPVAVFGEPYSYQIEAEGSQPMTFTGDISYIEGLTLSESGLISGTPLRKYSTHTGSRTSFTVTATNSTGSAKKELTLYCMVKPDISTDIPNGKVGEYYSHQLSATENLDAPIANGEINAYNWGWLNPLTWRLVDGALPEGLELDTRGKIAGIPTDDGRYTFTVEASVSGVTNTAELTIDISDGSPKITTTTLANAFKNEIYNAYIEAKGTGPFTWEFVDGKLPNGLTFSSTSSYAKISGTPKYEDRDFKFIVRVLNEKGSDEREFSINVYMRPKISTNATLVSGRVGEIYRTSLLAEGTAPLTWSLKSGNLPDGLELDSQGNITGTPKTSDTFKFTARAANSYGYDDREFTISVVTSRGSKPEILTNSLPSPAAFGKDYSAALSATGTGPITWSIEGKKPAGLSINSITGQITGKPSKEGKLKFKVAAANSFGKTTKSFTIVVGRAPEFISANVPASGLVGKSYKATLKASGAKTLIYSIASGNFPSGVTLNQKGKISGKPKAPGVYKFTVMVKNDYGTDYQSFSVSIGMKPSISKQTLPSGTIGKTYGPVTLTAAGSTPLTWSKASGKLPDGITISSSGVIFGTPKQAGKFSFKVIAANIYGNHKQSFKITIAKASTKGNEFDEDDYEDDEDVTVNDETSEIENVTSTPESYSGISEPETQKDISGIVYSEKPGASLHVIGNDGEPANETVSIKNGQDLLFELGAWFDKNGREFEPSGAKVYVNNEAVEAKIEDDGTFILDAGDKSDEFTVYVKASSPSGEKLKSDEIRIVIE
ncbi:MAG: putative Ig domain-containing protein [Synergistaceae bacterium]|nr:putative Ig domain-containing protein [Synergistaceae bacterium]